jgi:hypothetical protein
MTSAGAEGRSKTMGKASVSGSRREAAEVPLHESSGDVEQRETGPGPADYQKAVLRVLADGPCTLREVERGVADQLGIPPESPVEAQLDAMESVGLIKRSGNKLSLTDHGEQLAPFARTLTAAS